MPISPDDPELEVVVNWFESQERLVERTGLVIRQAIDDVIDGPLTGRYAYEQLDNVEKTYIGFRVEYRLLNEFGLDKCPPLDTKILDIPVDVKWSARESWMIPEEAIGQLCLLLWADDKRSQFSFGIIRVNRAWLTNKSNRDRKFQIRADARYHIYWFAKKATLPENFLFHLDPETREAILSTPKGTRRLMELFRRVQNRPIPRLVIETLALQKDPVRRARQATAALLREGILVLQGHWKGHRETANSHGYQISSNEWIAIRTGERE